MPIITSLLVFVFVSICVSLSLKSLLEIFAMVRTGEAVNLFENVSKRIDSVVQYVFFHKKVLEDKSYGFMHMFYLYGFLVLGIGHLEVVLYGLTRFMESFGYQPFLYRNFLPGTLVHLIDLSQDTMAFLVVVMVSIALFRRIIIPKKRLLPRSKDAEIILWLILALYVSFFIYIPSDVAIRVNDKVLPSGFLWYYPVSSLLAQAFNLSQNIEIFHWVGFWTHLGVFLGFMVYIPRSKHLHLIAAGPNIYFRHLDKYAEPRTIDFDKAETFGVEKVFQLSWKSLLDTFACTECGRCDEVCPAANTKKSLFPKKVLHDIKMNLRGENWRHIKQYHNLFGQVLPKKEGELLESTLKVPLLNREKIDPEKVKESGAYAIEGQIHLDDLWACTTCAACVEVCPVLIDSVPTSLMEMRRHLVMMEANDYPKELNSALRGMENQKNPWGVATDKREEWAQNLDVPIMKDKGEAQYLFWVGCAGSTDDRAKKIQQALVRILKKAQVDYAILGCEEKCTGDPARRMGNEYLFDMLAKENIATLSKYKFKKIFTSCPHCFNSLGNEYKELGGNYEVMHHTQLIEELFNDGKLSLELKDKLEENITFHDPCYLGRYNKEYQAPRNLINKAYNKPVEMKFNKEKSFCCGAGGGRMFMEENIGSRINHERTQQAIDCGAKTIATGCPFCMTMLKDGVADKGQEDNIKVKDVAEIVAEHL